jgi:hypothetical protein
MLATSSTEAKRWIRDVCGCSLTNPAAISSSSVFAAEPLGAICRWTVTSPDPYRGQDVCRLMNGAFRQ